VRRRTFIAWWIAGLLTATVVGAIAPLLVFIYPSLARIKKANLEITLEKAIADLTDGEAVKFEAPSQAGFIMQDGGGDNGPGKVAFAAYAVRSGSTTNVFAINCSHLGCSIALNPETRRFDCPCHGSQFSLDGKVLHGPAVEPLSHLKWSQGPDPKTILVESYQGLV
jgi:Rieske Fe-S protein